MRTVLCFLLFGSVVVVAAAKALPGSQAASDIDGLRTMRVILSTESNKPFGVKKGFGRLSDVLKVAGTAVPAKAIDRDTATLGDSVLRVTLSSDKKHFVATLAPAKGCGPAWFGNESDVIYAGKALGC